MRQLAVILSGQRWRVRWVTRLGKVAGTAHDKAGDCDKGERLIRLLHGLSEHEERRVLIHEMLHAECDWLDEQHVDEISARINDALAKCGHEARRTT